MPKDIIVNYYRLCAARLGKREHLVEQLKPEVFEILVTDIDVRMYLRKRNNSYVARENVIGGNNTKQSVNHEPALII